VWDAPYSTHGVESEWVSESTFQRGERTDGGLGGLTGSTVRDVAGPQHGNDSHDGALPCTSTAPSSPPFSWACGIRQEQGGCGDLVGVGVCLSLSGLGLTVCRGSRDAGRRGAPDTGLGAGVVNG